MLIFLEKGNDQPLFMFISFDMIVSKACVGFLGLAPKSKSNFLNPFAAVGICRVDGPKSCFDNLSQRRQICRPDLYPRLIASPSEFMRHNARVQLLTNPFAQFCRTEPTIQRYREASIGVLFR